MRLRLVEMLGEALPAGLGHGVGIAAAACGPGAVDLRVGGDDLAQPGIDAALGDLGDQGGMHELARGLVPIDGGAEDIAIELPGHRILGAHLMQRAHAQGDPFRAQRLGLGRDRCALLHQADADQAADAAQGAECRVGADLEALVGLGERLRRLVELLARLVTQAAGIEHHRVIAAGVADLHRLGRDGRDRRRPRRFREVGRQVVEDVRSGLRPRLPMVGGGAEDVAAGAQIIGVELLPPGNEIGTARREGDVAAGAVLGGETAGRHQDEGEQREAGGRWEGEASQGRGCVHVKGGWARA